MVCEELVVLGEYFIDNKDSQSSVKQKGCILRIMTSLDNQCKDQLGYEIDVIINCAAITYDKA